MMKKNFSVKIKNFISKLISLSPNLLAFKHLLRSNIRSYKIDLQSIHNLFLIKTVGTKSALDLGCGSVPKNMFSADEIKGLDLIENNAENVFKCKLGFERIPFADNTFDYLTAYDLIEHIPRFSEVSENGPPFIFFMNECYRVLKKGGVFLSKTPVYPYLGAFQDPTHNNIITIDTFRLYFSNEKYDVAKHYGFDADFKIIDQKMYYQWLIAVMTK